VPLRISPLTRSDWKHLEALFGPRGLGGGCWCMAMRVASRADYERGKGASNRAAFKRLVESGMAKGLLAFSGDTPIGWCSLGPRAHFPRLDRSAALGAPTPEGGWIVNCFYVAARWRRAGVGRALLEAAGVYARERGASTLDGYPVQVARGASRAPQASWSGVTAMFEDCGFEDAGPLGQIRRIYRLNLGRPKTRSA
jgi:GNAT superfamily N-acetyltransferase